MPYTTASGVPIPISTDAFSPTTQFKAWGDKAATYENRVIVADDAARSSLAAPVLRPQLICTVIATDVTWIYNGTTWKIQSSPWKTFAPTLGQASGSFAVGNGTLTALWRYNGEDTEIIFRLLFGSTTTVGAGSYFVTPTNMDSTIPPYSDVGRGTFGLTSGSTINDGCAFKSGAASNQIQFGAWSTSGPYSALVGITATVPLGGWTTNYYIDMLIRYRTA